MVTSVIRLAAAIAVAASLAYASAGNASTVGVAPNSPESAASAKRGFDLANLDPTCKACDDFYRYANGGWIDGHPLDAQHARFGSFIELAERNQQMVHAILEDAAAKPGPPGSPAQLVGDMYAACTDLTKRNAAGLTPIAGDLALIAKAGDLAAIRTATAHVQDIGAGAFFVLVASADQRDSQHVIAQLGAGGLGMPDRDYYLKTDPDSVRIRAAYVSHVGRILALAGGDAAAAAAQTDAVMAIETALAKAARTNVERRNPLRNYNKLALTDLQASTPHFDWNAYLAERGAPAIVSLNVMAPEYFAALDGLLSSTPPASLRAYLKWRLLDRYASALSATFADEAFAWSGTTLTGQKEQQPLWKRCASSVDAALGQALGIEYVKRAFPPEARVRVRQLVKNVEAALKEDLETLAWMSPATRTEAVAKLDALGEKIGYPEKWRDYAGLTIDRSSYAADLLHETAYESRRNLMRIGNTVDRTEFSMTPPTVNARYSATLNDILFPAGILQAPFFDPNADDAVNYGGIGAVIGHEMTHGFDDSGRRYDGAGNLRDWWTAEDATKYTARATCVEKQFDGFVAVKGEGGAPDLHVNGKLVLGESIADLGGMTIAYKAFKRTPEGGSTAKIDGFTPDQRFFLGYAHIWAENITPQAARLRTTTDPHPLNRFRVNGPLSNMPEFATAFACRRGDPMVRAAAERCRIW